MGQRSDLDVSGEHLSERCGLFIILALGEMLLVTGARGKVGRSAVEALTALRRIGGTAAVTEFARERVRSVIGHVRPAEGPHDVERAATDIATALSGAGYASSVEEAGTGLQICQHHCSV